MIKCQGESAKKRDIIDSSNVKRQAPFHCWKWQTTKLKMRVKLGEQGGHRWFTDYERFTPSSFTTDVQTPKTWIQLRAS